MKKEANPIPSETGKDFKGGFRWIGCDKKMKRLLIALVSSWVLSMGAGPAVGADTTVYESLKQDLVGLDYLLRNVEFTEIQCDLGACELVTADQSYQVNLRRASPVEYKRERLLYVLKLRVRSPLITSSLQVDYIQDPPSIIVGRNGWSEPIPPYEKTMFGMVGRWVPLLQTWLRREGLSID